MVRLSVSFASLEGFLLRKFCIALRTAQIVYKWYAYVVFTSNVRGYWVLSPRPRLACSALPPTAFEIIHDWE